MSFIDISLLGDKKLEKSFKKIELKLQKKIFKAAVKDAAKPILALAKSYVPVDTGKLKDSIKLKAGTGKRGTIGVRIETGTRAQLGISADDKFFYPTVVEYKHKSYLRRAIDSDPDGVRRAIARNIKAAIG